jgi:hypothetical protein
MHYVSKARESVCEAALNTFNLRDFRCLVRRPYTRYVFQQRSGINIEGMHKR